MTNESKRLLCFTLMCDSNHIYVPCCFKFTFAFFNRRIISSSIFWASVLSSVLPNRENAADGANKKIGESLNISNKMT